MITSGRLLLCLALVTTAVSSSAWQQPATARKFPPDAFVNLQVFPKDVRQDVLIQAMKNFTRDLGVRCDHCHVGTDGQPLTEFDFASDANPRKDIARSMVRMAGEVNARLRKDLPNATAQGYQVTCFTCHRGAAHPVHSPEATTRPPGR